MTTHSVSSPLSLVIDDDHLHTSLLRTFLKMGMFVSLTFDCCEDALHFMRLVDEPLFCIFVDPHLSRGTAGLACLSALRAFAPDVPLVLMTADRASLPADLPAVSRQPVLQKPLRAETVDDVLRALRRS